MKHIAIGIIKSNWGTLGHLKVHSFSGEFRHFFKLKEVYLAKKNNRLEYLEYKIKSVQKRATFLLMELEGIDNPEKARELSGWEIWVDRAHACPTGKDEYYEADLCGCSVCRNTTRIGKVRSVLNAGAWNLLEVIDKRGKTLMIPFREHFIARVDLKKGQVFLEEDCVID